MIQNSGRNETYNMEKSVQMTRHKYSWTIGQISYCIPANVEGTKGTEEHCNISD